MTARQLDLGAWAPPASREPTASKARDHVLAAMERHRAESIEVARAVAMRLAHERPSGITASDVLAEMRRLHPSHMARVPDARFLGAVLLPSLGWKKVGERASGHHARKQPVWSR